MSSLPVKTILSLLFLFVVSSVFYLKKIETGLPFVSKPEWQQRKPGNLSPFDLLETPVYIERQERLKRECNSYQRREHALLLNASHFTPGSIWNSKEVLEHIIVDEKHRLLYCYVPKVACTNWKRTLLFLSGQTNVTKPLDIPADLVHRSGVLRKLANYSIKEAAEMLQSYSTFLLVRHPLERLVSAYRNKLEQKYSSSKYFQSRFGRHIVKKYRKNPSNYSLEHGDDVTFPEFATYLTTEVASDGEFNEHWKPIHQLCAPCAVQYDIIGKYETLYEDADFLLHQLGEPVSAFPRYVHHSNTTTTFSKYLESLTVDLLHKLYSIYEVDFRLFGYSLQELLGFELG